MRAGAPERSCVVCKRRAAKAELLRLVLHGRQLLVDDAQKAMGRGAYVHRDAGCVTQLTRGGVLARAFHVDEAELERESVVAVVQRFRAPLDGQGEGKRRTRLLM